MFSKRVLRVRFRSAVSVFCIMDTLVWGMLPLLVGPGTWGATEPERARSNHRAQIKVDGPLGVRVNTWSGNLFYRIPLLTMPGRGIPLELSTSYNSAWHDVDTPFGYGWQLSYNMFYLREESGDIIVVWQDGRSDRFVKDGEGGFLSPVDTYDTLEEYEPSKYIVQAKDGRAFYFDSPIHKRLTGLREPNGNGLTFLYDAEMRLTAINDTVGRQIQLSYSGGKLATITDPNTTPARTILLQYDVGGNLTGVTDVLGNATAYGYAADHLLTSIAPPVGDPATITYTAGAVTHISGEGTTRSFTHDAASRVTTMSDVAPEGDQVTRFHYDADGRINAIEDPLGNQTSLAWDQNNNLTSVRDANSNSTSYGYDQAGNLTSVMDAVGGPTSYTYGTAYNRLTSITDANGHTRTYEYDDAGNLTHEIDALGNPTVFTYDDQGDLTSRTDANGVTTTYEHDTHGNLMAIHYPDATQNSYQYDAVGNMTRMTNPNADVLHTYDELNRLTLADVDSHAKAVGYEYDTVGNRVSMTDPDGGTTTYTYDAANRLSTLTNPLGQTTSYSHDSRGRLIHTDHHNGTFADYGYDAANRLLTLVNKKSSGEIISSFTYEYDSVGNRTKMIEANGDETTYAYDALYRLTSVTYPDVSTTTYTYDPVGNRLTMADADGTTTYAYDDADRLLSAGPVTYGWDNNGNMISKAEGAGTTVYGYDYENLLTSIVFPDTGRNAFSYYPDGRRLSRTDRSSEMWNYFYDGRNAIIETTSTGATRATYTSGLAVDDWIAMHMGGNTYFYHRDGLASVTVLTSENESVEATYSCDVFGEPRSESGVIATPHRYTGREYDTESQLYFYRARYYDPGIGGFLTKDPVRGHLADPMSLSPYVYVRDNPATFVDPDGTNLLIHVGVHVVIFILELIFAEELNQGENDEPPDLDGDGTGDGDDAGIESRPLALIPSAYLAAGSVIAMSTAKPRGDPLVALTDLFPNEGPPGTSPVEVTPPGPLGGSTNAVEAVAVDFVDSQTDTTKATVFATKTMERAYEHDYSVCNRFHDYTLETAAAMPLPGIVPAAKEVPWFWYLSTTKADFVEETFIFAVFVDEDTTTFTVDSRWLGDYYPAPPSPEYEYIFNFQVWASSSQEAYKLLRRTLTKLSQVGPEWTVNFANTIEPIGPKVLMTAGELQGSNVHLRVQNWLAEPRTVSFFGTFRDPSDRTTNVPFEIERLLDPGFNMVELPLGSVIDAVVQVEVDGFLDRVYVGGGFWFVFDDAAVGGSSSASLTLPECDSADNLTLEDSVLAGCAQMTGTVGPAGWVGVGRTLNPNGRAIDVSEYQALTFFARGDGKSYRVNLETDAVAQAGSTDFHQFVFTTSANWRQYVIPLTSFTQQGWDPDNPVAFTGTDVKAVVWLSIGEPHDSISLTVDRIALTDSTLISNTTRLPDTSNTAGPYEVKGTIADETNIEAAALLYSVDGAKSFTRVAMTSEGDAFRAEIPGQLLGSEVQYYVEAEDADGNLATDPVDVPYTTYRFQVSNRPHLLVDDFRDTNPINVLGGSAFFFGSESGGAVVAQYDGDLLQLDYDVTTAGSFAGYSTLLNGANLTPYSALTLMIRGDTGWERVKVGLRDSLGNESRIVAGEYLVDGIATFWRKVTVPLSVFTHIGDWSDMASIVLVVENRLGSGAGTIRIDDIKLDHILLVPIVVDNYNDMAGENALGGGLWSSIGGSATIDAGYDTTHAHGSVGAAYRVSFAGVNGTSWAALGMNLLGVDASEYETLSLDIMGADGGERPNIYFGSGEGATEVRRFVDIEDYAEVTTSWTRVLVTLEDFTSQGVDTSNLSYLEVVFEWEDMSGSIFLDNMRLLGLQAGNADRNSIIDLEDFAVFANCLTGPAALRPGSGCEQEQFYIMDLDSDGDVDLFDFQAFSGMLREP